METVDRHQKRRLLGPLGNQTERPAPGLALNTVPKYYAQCFVVAKGLGERPMSPASERKTYIRPWEMVPVRYSPRLVPVLYLAAVFWEKKRVAALDMVFSSADFTLPMNNTGKLCSMLTNLE
jgi:hypothetical protein